MHLVFLTVLSCILFWAAEAQNYCDRQLCSGGGHIGCRHNGNFSPSCPRDATMVRMTPNLINEIVEGHNRRREIVASGRAPNHAAACRMATMQWDNELAYLASLNVRQCQMQHDRCRNTRAFRFSGQNLAWRGSTGTENPSVAFQRVIQSWYNEVRNSNQGFIDSYPRNHRGPAIGHFTVMVADRNIRVGCAAATYSRSGMRIFLAACNYATTNMIGRPIYKKCQRPGAECRTGRNRRFPNLCSPNERYDVNNF